MPETSGNCLTLYIILEDTCSGAFLSTVHQEMQIHSFRADFGGFANTGHGLRKFPRQSSSCQNIWKSFTY